MAKKEFTYRGKTIEELKALAVNEFAQLCTARARRTLNRGFSEEEKKLLNKIRNHEKNIKTHIRGLIILPEMVDTTIKVHNGKDFVAIQIMPEMVGHTLGEYALTRKRVGHNSPGVGATKSSSHVSMK